MIVLRFKGANKQFKQWLVLLAQHQNLNLRGFWTGGE